MWNPAKLAAYQILISRVEKFGTRSCKSKIVLINDCSYTVITHFQKCLHLFVRMWFVLSLSTIASHWEQYGTGQVRAGLIYNINLCQRSSRLSKWRGHYLISKKSSQATEGVKEQSAQVCFHTSLLSQRLCIPRLFWWGDWMILPCERGSQTLNYFLLVRAVLFNNCSVAAHSFCRCWKEFMAHHHLGNTIEYSTIKGHGVEKIQCSEDCPCRCAWLLGLGRNACFSYPLVLNMWSGLATRQKNKTKQKKKI